MWIMFNSDKVIFRAPSYDQIKHHIMYSASYNLKIMFIIYGLDHTSVDELIEIARCNFPFIFPMTSTHKSFSHPPPSKLILANHLILRVEAKIQKACL